ncbi:MBL fold metallo-hydrolase [Gryllotalpicola daejeonensis]|uniref:MBL fold metallo-hydrolase n=1 Tax=Gryllotalpicola daejeonensis TaxID=993087 RepID=A0ABP7ZIE1_9MICO
MSLIAVEPELISCATCGVEYGADREALPEVCPICADERQYVPQSGQAWVTQGELAERAGQGGGVSVDVVELGPDQWGVTAHGVGIAQTMQVVRTTAGVLLWDPTGLADQGTVEFVRSLGPVLAIVASHPHMYGAQLAWSRALGDAPVLVSEADREWLQRDGAAVELWSGSRGLAEGLTLHTLGGHFPGSAVAHWARGAGGAGVLLAGDTIMVNSDHRTVSFLRSYPNRLPLSGAVVARIAASVERMPFQQIWSNFSNAITADADRRVQESAERHIGWVRGDFDDLT